MYVYRICMYTYMAHTHNHTVYIIVYIHIHYTYIRTQTQTICTVYTQIQNNTHLYVYIYGYGSIPIDTFLVGWTSINPSYDLGFTRYQGFDPSPCKSPLARNEYLWEDTCLGRLVLPPRSKPQMLWTLLGSLFILWDRGHKNVGNMWEAMGYKP